jgi:transglycosylase-like protein with SLT domain
LGHEFGGKLSFSRLGEKNLEKTFNYLFLMEFVSGKNFILRVLRGMDRQMWRKCHPLQLQCWPETRFVAILCVNVGQRAGGKRRAVMMTRMICAALISLGLSFGMASAETPPPFKDFSAKRVKPPKAGVRKRITIQIEPEVIAPEIADDAPASVPTAPRTARYDWFWEEVSPDIAQAGAGRLDLAMRALARAKAPVSVPRLQQMQSLAKSRGVDILKATIGTEVSPALVLAVMMVESGGKVDAVSSAGAQGLMQLMPDTASRFGVTDSFEAAQNITGGVKYLNWLMGTFDRDPVLVLAGYNAGEGSVRTHQGVPPFAETRDYVPKVLAAFQIARGLCITPPELASDGCVFAALN